MACAALGPFSAANASEPNDKQRILVIGDSLAGELYLGLYEAYRGDKSVSVKRNNKISSGIVRDDFYDWNKKAAQIAAKGSADIVLMMIGGNDGQPIRVAGQRYRERVGTDLWRKTYGDRVEAIIREFHDRGVRFYWVGMPIQRKKRDNKVGQTINELFRERSARVGTGFIDAYDLFDGDDGKYATHLTDDRGKRKRMRHKDGMHFSTSGSKWLGRVVKRVIEQDTASDVASADGATPEAVTD